MNLQTEWEQQVPLFAKAQGRRCHSPLGLARAYALGVLASGGRIG
jgi:hypothetical protein